MTENVIKGFLFDMDGTVFDTERIYHDGWKWLGDDLGIEIPDILIDSMRGSGMATAKKLFADHFRGRLDYMEARTRRQAYLDRVFEENGVPLKPGAKELLTWLKAHGYGIALATSTRLSTTEFYLERSGLGVGFDAIVSGDMVKKGKPDPEIFLTAAQRLGLDIRDCAVCEDSLNGIMAGRRSGATVYYIPDLNHMTKEQLDLYVDRSFDSLLDILAMLEG